MVYIYMPLDPRAAFLEELGMKVPESITSMAGDGDFSVDLSAENIDLLNDVDVIVCYGDDSLLGELQANELMSTVPADCKRGSSNDGDDQRSVHENLCNSAIRQSLMSIDLSVAAAKS